jgi:hypothetical protein
MQCLSHPILCSLSPLSFESTSLVQKLFRLAECLSIHLGERMSSGFKRFLQYLSVISAAYHIYKGTKPDT